MRKLPKQLEEPFLKIIGGRSLSSLDRSDYLKWLRSVNAELRRASGIF